MLALLIESALRSLLLGLAVWVGLRIFGVRSPHLQMMAWTVVVAASLAMPVLMRGLAVTVPVGAPQLVKIARVPDALTSPYLQPDVPAFPPLVADSGEAPPPRMAPAARGDGRSVATWWSVATAFYLLAACVMLFRLLLGLVLTWRLRQAAQPIREPWTAGSDVRVSSSVSMPVTAEAQP